MYIHRTASDFLTEDQTWNHVLETTSNINFGVHCALFRGFTPQLKTCSSGTATTAYGFEMLLATPLSLVYYTWKEKNPPTVETIDASLMILSSLRPGQQDILRYDYSLLEKNRPQDTLIFAVRASLLSYISAKLALPGQIPIPRLPCAMSYLYCVLNENIFTGWPLIGSERITAFLLPHSSGIDIEEGWNMALIAAEARICSYSDDGRQIINLERWEDEFRMWLATLKPFLEYGANPSTKVNISNSKLRRRLWGGRSTCSAINIRTYLAKTCPVEAAEVEALPTRGRTWRYRLGFSKLNASIARPKVDWTQFPGRTWWKDWRYI